MTKLHSEKRPISRSVLPILRPKLDPRNTMVLEQTELLFELEQAFGSPLSLVFPEKIVENLQEFEKVFAKHFLQGSVYFAHKTNRSSALVKTLACTQSGRIDVASQGELEHALGCGFSGTRIGATGPKNESFLRLSIQHDVLISIDSQAELETCIKICSALKKTARITIRLSGIQTTATNKKVSRFGLSSSSLEKVFALLKNQHQIELKGFAFHLDSTSLKERASAITTAVQLITQARNLGFNPTIINIGGGYKTNYISEKSEWDTFLTQLKESILGYREPITLNNYGYGLWSENGILKGSLNIYSFYDGLVGAQYLDALFSYIPESGDSTVAEILADSLIELMIEPGRALADLAGITLAKINFVKQSEKGDTLLGLGMNKSDVGFFEHDLGIDPILIQQASLKDKSNNQDERVKNEELEPVSAYLIGNLCLEGDFITARKINFSQTPKAGDILAFINTAGYYSDFSANQALMQPSAKKIALTRKSEKFIWSTDERYEPLCSLIQ